MDRILRAEEMRSWDRYTIEKIGVPSAVLMERASLAAAEKVLSCLSEQEIGRDQTVLVLAGSGNNGGDGFACARILSLKGISVRVIETGRLKSMTEETKRQREICLRLNIPVLPLGKLAEEEISGELGNAKVIVDAMLGTGLTRTVEGALAELINAVNLISSKEGALRKKEGIDLVPACSLPKYVIAVDIPSGISSDTGEVMGTAIRADATVTMQCAKPGLLLYPGALYAGEIFVAEIGVTSPDDQSDSPIYSLREGDLRKALPIRDPSGNKGTFGKVLVIAGTKGMAGASILAAEAALRTGCGMVKVLTVEENRLILQSTLPEALLATYRLGEDGQAIEALHDGINWCDVVLMGPGIGIGATQRVLLDELLRCCGKPIVLDADALNLVSENPSLLRATVNLLQNENSLQKKEASQDAEKVPYLQKYTGKELLSGKTGSMIQSGFSNRSICITPHVGEMSRLTGLTIAEIKRDLLECARHFSEEYQVTCVLKDARTVTATREGKLFINTSGNSGMGTAGSGDVLSGILASLLAQGTRQDLAAPAAVYLHGLAGDNARAEFGEHYMSAGDIVRGLAGVLRRIF